MLAVERDVKPRNMNFAKVEKEGGGRLIGRGRLLQQIRCIYICCFDEVLAVTKPKIMMFSIISS